MIRALALSIALFAAACATTDGSQPTAPSAPEASIPFADFGGIRSFRPGPDDTLLLEGTTGRWYQATFFGPCHDVPYAEQIGVISGPGGRVDRFSGIIVRGQTCRFRSLVEIPDPDARPADAPAEAQAPPQN
jgi:hypothetical protein